MISRKNLILSIAAIFVAGLSWAKPAMRGVRTVEQPNGSFINIMRTGDEFLHFTTTEDGFLLQEDENGFFHIAYVASDGAILSTGLLPTEDNLKLYGVNLKDIKSEVFAKRAEVRKNKRTAPQSGLGLVSSTYPTTGSPKGLIILVEYSDVKFKSLANYDAKDYFNDMINGENFSQFGGTGSALQYFKDQSGEKFTPDFDVLGPVTLPQKQAYYGANDRDGQDLRPEEMVTHAIEILNPDHDFSVYDTDKDGVIDNVYIFYAGQGEADYGSANTVWPHSWDVRYSGKYIKVDGVTIGTYACSNEWSRNRPDGLGTFVHEFSHVMGLPDLYNTMDDVYYTPGDYSVLDYGPYNNDSRTPPNYGSYEKNALGWYEPLMLDGPFSVILNEISSGDFGLIPTSSKTEFFLLENRQQTGWDKYIQAHGMLIWHIDYNKTKFENNEVNNNRNHQYVDLVEANNQTDYEKYGKGYTFPGTTGKDSFTASTEPALKDWKGNAINLPVTNIKEENGIITFDVAGGGDTPEAGIESVEDLNVNPEYFNLQGVRISNPVPGTVIIERKGTTTKKIVF